MILRNHRMKIGVLTAGLTLGLSAVFVAQPVRAQTAAVTIMNFSFQPATTTVPVGATVTWTNQDAAAHTSTSDTGVWDSGSLPTGRSFSFTFNQAGTFPYHCTFHPGMHGTVIVQSAGTAVPTSGATSVAATAVTSAATATSIPLSAYPVGAGSPLRMGPAHVGTQTSWLGYYDGRKDVYLSTDASDKTQASMMHVNFARALSKTPMSSTPAIYLVKGRAPANQLAVFGSEPGSPDYSPLWHEVVVQWKSGATPQLLTSDNQILTLAKQGKLSTKSNRVILNCPIIKVGK